MAGVDSADARALAANDVRVMVSQLNDAIKRAAEQRLRIQVDTASHVDVRGRATYYPVVSAHVWMEVE